MSNPIEKLAQLKNENSDLAELLEAVEAIDGVYRAIDATKPKHHRKSGTASSNFTMALPSFSAASVIFEEVNYSSAQQQQQQKQDTSKGW